LFIWFLDANLSGGSFQPKAFRSQFRVKKEIFLLLTNCKSLFNAANDKLVGVAQVKFQKSVDEAKILECMFTPVSQQVI